MGEILRPRNVSEVLDAVRWAAAGARPLEVLGTGSRRALGRPVEAPCALELSGLSGITLYEPEELVLTAAAGTPRAEIEAALAEKGQALAFEPIDTGPLLGRPQGEGTLGGLVASGLSGPRRLKSGAARDHVLGFSAVSGRGEVFKSGGRVVKNVTGYDLSKLMTGSWGTLAVLTSITLKVLPRAADTATIAVLGLEDAAAARIMSRAMGSPNDVSGAAHLPAAVAARVPAAAAAGRGLALTLLRIEGFAPSVAARREALVRLVAGSGELEVLDHDASAVLWRAVRDVMPFANGEDWPVWKISVAPAAGPQVVAFIRQRLDGRGTVEAFYDWAGGLVWLAIADADPQAATVRAAVAAAGGGHATLMRAPAAARSAVSVFEPQPPPLAALTRRIKAAFDPKGILNPGRMVAGM